MLADVSKSPPLQQTPTKIEREQQVRRERRLQLYGDVVRLHQEGQGNKRIARTLGTSPQTVRRFLRAGSFPERARGKRRTLLDSHLPYLQSRWQAGCHNSSQLWREIRERGFRGACSLLRGYLGKWRKRDALVSQGSFNAAPAASLVAGNMTVPPLSSRRATWLLLRKIETLDSEEHALRGKLLALCPEALKASELAASFRAVLRGCKPKALSQWLQNAKNSELEEMKSFANGLERDQAAVEAAIKLHWSNGQVEGQVHRLKLLKRQMYGRAKFDLLRARVLRSG